MRAWNLGVVIACLAACGDGAAGGDAGLGSDGPASDAAPPGDVAPPVISAADWADVATSILSPEDGVVIDPEKVPSLDLDGDGVLTLADVSAAGMGTWSTVFVAPSSIAGSDPSAPVGSRTNPVIVTATTTPAFYAAIRQITFGAAARDAEVVFLPGRYARVQLAIRNGDVSADTLPAWKLLVPAVIDAEAPRRLVLRALHPVTADPGLRTTFDGETAGADPLRSGPALRTSADALDGNIPVAITIEGALDVDGPKRRISGVLLSGIAVTNYPRGVLIRYAEKVVVKNCDISLIGSARTNEESELDTDAVPFAPEAIGIDRQAQALLIKHNHIVDTWNRIDADAPVPANVEYDTALVHPFYIRDVRDIVYIDNRVENSSGAMFKTNYSAKWNCDGTLQSIVGGSTDDPRVVGPGRRRQVLINNHFSQAFDLLGGAHPRAQYVFSMIHDNSARAERISAVVPNCTNDAVSDPTPPNAGLIFLGNTWETAVTMDFLRRESVTDDPIVRFPDWTFVGNRFVGFPYGPRIVERRRGQPVESKTDITEEVTTSPNETVRFVEPSTAISYDQAREALRELIGPEAPRSGLTSEVAGADALVLDTVTRREIAGVSTLE